MLVHLHDACVCALAFSVPSPLYIPHDFTAHKRQPGAAPLPRAPPRRGMKQQASARGPVAGQAPRCGRCGFTWPCHGTTMHVSIRVRKHMHHGGAQACTDDVRALPTVIQTEIPPETCCSQRNRDEQLEGPGAALSQNATGAIRGLASQRGHSG